MRSLLALCMLLLAGALFSACDSSDDSDEDSLYLRFRANGSQVEFTNPGSLLGTFSQSGSQYVGVFTGFDAQSNMALQVYSNAPIATETYTGYNLVGGAFVGALIGYQDPSGTLFTQGSGAVIDSRITITELTSTTVEGTFQGTLTAAGQEVIAVTNGEFRVNRVN